MLLLAAARLGETGNHTVAECERHAQDYLHFFHGQNALSMLYLSNMAALGGDHSFRSSSTMLGLGIRTAAIH